MSEANFGFLVAGWMVGCIFTLVAWNWSDRQEEKDDEMESLRENLFRTNIKINDLRYDFEIHKGDKEEATK